MEKFTLLAPNSPVILTWWYTMPLDTLFCLEALIPTPTLIGISETLGPLTRSKLAPQQRHSAGPPRSLISAIKRGGKGSLRDLKTGDVARRPRVLTFPRT